MKKIGEGFYYNVYDLGNGRVVKRRTSWISRVRKVIAWRKRAGRKLFEAINPLSDKKRFYQSIQVSKEVLELLNPKLLGNPSFVNFLEYEQDKAIIVKDLVHNQNDEEFIRRIKEYVLLAKKLWSIGFGDTVFNFTINNGVSEKTGQLIWVDFNDFTKSKETMAYCIKAKKWETQASLRYFPKERSALKDRIIKLFEKEFTIPELQRIWKERNKEKHI